MKLDGKYIILTLDAKKPSVISEAKQQNKIMQKIELLRKDEDFVGMGKASSC